jgi:septal ring factor EnvC (AmiA/AmiB activator)
MVYTLGQAAKAVGKSKTAVSHAISSGRITATKDAFNRWVIDPAELFRVYPQTAKDLTISGDVAHQAASHMTPEIKATVEGLEKLCRQIESERDNLRAELANANEERRTVLRQLTALLTDQRVKPRRWWFGKREGV